MKQPSLDEWLSEAKKHPDAGKCGMYLFHNGTVRETARAQVREGKPSEPVKGMSFTCDRVLAEAVAQDTGTLPGIYYVRVFLNEGILAAGDTIMTVLVGGDIRPRVVEALNYCVGRLKAECVREEELF